MLMTMPEITMITRRKQPDAMLKATLTLPMTWSLVTRRGDASLVAIVMLAVRRHDETIMCVLIVVIIIRLFNLRSGGL